jgi:hypothetical protein
MPSSGSSARRNRKGGPQAAFGRLYQWLQFAKNEKDPGPIRDVVRDFIIENMAADPGTKLFGTVVEIRRRHSVASLARQSGLHATTLGRAVVRAGLLPAAKGSPVDGFASVDASTGEALADLINSSIPITRIPSYLNCNRTQAEMLVKHGILRRIEPENGPRACILNYVSIHDLDAFLKRLRCCGEAVEQGGPGMLNMIEASERAKWPTVDIVRLVLGGCLSRIELLPREHRFKSVLVDPNEVRQRLHASENGSLLTIREAAERLTLRRTAVRALIARMNDDGRPYLAASSIKNAKGVRRVCVPKKEIERFAAEHVKLGTLAAERGVWDRLLRKRLEDQGILPILPRSVLDAYVYSRAEPPSHQGVREARHLWNEEKRPQSLTALMVEIDRAANETTERA